MADTHQFVRVEFSRFKAFKAFAFDIRHFNILVGPNNAGKSTILAAFRILASAMRRAAARKAQIIRGPQGATLGYEVDLASISIGEENIFFNYDESEPALIVFKLSNRSTLTLYFPEREVCYLLPEADGKFSGDPKSFKQNFNCQIGFVPILGPLEHHEPLFEKEAARLALFNYQAARNFRNIWYHYPEKFNEFQSAIVQTWPGMDIQRPEINLSHGKARLNMYCLEDRRSRELFWAGFGFQVWCQMLTHLIQSSDVSLFLIDEPDIYLHSELQRQLLGILRALGPDILIATHSTEIITEADTDDILLINKNARSARRIRGPSQLGSVFSALGSSLNPILTQLAKTRRVLFVEGNDFQILGRFARKLGALGVGNQRGFAVVPVEGFNPERVKNLKAGMETTLGGEIVAAAVFDRDYRCEAECQEITAACKSYCDYVSIHGCKEIENLLLVPAALDRAIVARVAEKSKRLGTSLTCIPDSTKILIEFSEASKSNVMSQYIAERRRFVRSVSPSTHEATVTKEALDSFERGWADPATRMGMISGKDALSAINNDAQARHGVSLTATAIIEAMRLDEIPRELAQLVETLAEFSTQSPN